MSGEARAFTKAVADELVLAIKSAPSPEVMVMSGYSRAVFVVTDRSVQERWDWRRTKRELRRIGLKRKGVRREYHKRNIA